MGEVQIFFFYNSISVILNGTVQIIIIIIIIEKQYK